jgi:biopolymer transport protein ExbB
MGFSLAEILRNMGLPAKIVGGLLLAMGLAWLTVFVERLFALGRSRQASRQFASELARELRRDRLKRAIATAARYSRAHLARLVGAALATYTRAHEAHDGSGLSPVERTRRHVERLLEELGADLRRGLPVLASVGSVAPFVGLLGTVLGIISAFQGIAATGSGGLSSVSAGISEALIETALGLAVAIPAVLAFNYLSTIVARDEQALAAAAGELLDTLEGWGGPREEPHGERTSVAHEEGDRRELVA